MLVVSIILPCILYVDKGIVDSHHFFTQMNFTQM